MSDDVRPLISIVTPVFNEEATVPLFYERLSPVLEALAERYRFELLFTNNRSQDDTAGAVLALRAQDPRVQLLTLSRNYGYQYSVYAGLRQAAGDAVIVIDVDCEDPPEMIPTFIDGWEQGYDIVYGERGQREEPATLTLGRRIFYRLNRLIADSDIILDMAEFSLLSADVRDAVVSSRTTFPFVRAEIAHYGFERLAIPYDRGPRIVGESGYNLWGMTLFAIAGILSSTTFPLRLPLYVLPPLLLGNLLLFGADVAGLLPWGFEAAALLDLLYLCCSTSLLGLYASRTYRNVVSRPLAVIDWGRSAVDRDPAESPNAVPRLWSDVRRPRKQA
jgi:glycosyltransferase involved in cell wall biosynthesis